MKAVSRGGLLVGVALMAAGALAIGAQAQTPVSFIADDPTLGYEGNPIACDTGAADGTMDGGGFELELAFFDCAAGELGAEVECEGTVSLRPVIGDMGAAALNEGFRCDIDFLGICTISVVGPQETSPSLNVVFGDDSFEVTAEMEAGVDNPTCGPSRGTGSWSGLYEEVP